MTTQIDTSLLAEWCLAGAEPDDKRPHGLRGLVHRLDAVQGEHAPLCREAATLLAALVEDLQSVRADAATKLNEVERDVLEVIESFPGSTSSEVAAELGRPAGYVGHVIAVLRAHGLVYRPGMRLLKEPDWSAMKPREKHCVAQLRRLNERGTLPSFDSLAVACGLSRRSVCGYLERHIKAGTIAGGRHLHPTQAGREAVARLNGRRVA